MSIITVTQKTIHVEDISESPPPPAEDTQPDIYEDTTSTNMHQLQQQQLQQQHDMQQQSLTSNYGDQTNSSSQQQRTPPDLGTNDSSSSSMFSNVAKNTAGATAGGTNSGSVYNNGNSIFPSPHGGEEQLHPGSVPAAGQQQSYSSDSDGGHHSDAGPEPEPAEEPPARGNLQYDASTKFEHNSFVVRFSYVQSLIIYFLY